jgi:hypothetical protein
MQTFDDFDNNNYSLGEMKPFQFREDKTEEGTLKWLNDNFDKVYEDSFSRFIMYRRYINRYKNYDNKDGDGFVRTSNRDRGNTTRKPRVRVNFFFDLVESKVSSVSRMKTNTVFIPLNDSEQKDRNNAEACTMLTKHRMEELKFDYLMRDMDRKTFIFGHTFAHGCWNPDAGPLDPVYQEALKKFPDGKIPKLNEAGEVVGYIKEPLHVGDYELTIKTADKIFPERLKTLWPEVNHLDDIEWLHIDEVKARWPSKKNIIEKNERTYFSYEQQDTFIPDDMIMVRTFWHKPTRFHPKGDKIIYCDSCILEGFNEGFPYKFEPAQLPYIPDWDVEVPNEFWARPALVNIEQLNNMYDLIQSGVARNMGVASHPKLAIPEGSVDAKQLDNEFGHVFFRGPSAPQWIQHNYVNRGEFEIQDRLEKRMNQLMGRFEVSQGFVPQGVTAYSAIRYLDDQEVQRNSNTITKRRERILGIYRQAIAIMAQYYKAEDGRTIRILGKNNEYLIKSFKDFDFSKIYDVKLENISALSDTRSGRIADIMDINSSNQKDPLFGRKELIKVLDLGLDEAFKQESTYAADTSRTILEMILDGEANVPAPDTTDDYIEMYAVFARYVESIAYKLKLDAGIKKTLNAYINGLEFLIWEKAGKNPAFAMEVLQISKYPMFFKLPSPIQPPMPQGAPQPGQPTLDTSAMTNKQKEIETSMNNKEQTV